MQEDFCLRWKLRRQFLNQHDKMKVTIDDVMSIVESIFAMFAANFPAHLPIIIKYIAESSVNSRQF